MVMVANQPPYWIASWREATITPVPPLNDEREFENKVSVSVSSCQQYELEGETWILNRSEFR
jgi:hypothetical protein